MSRRPAGPPRALTSHPKGDSQGRFSKDGSQVAFLSSRDGAPQVYVLDLAGGEARRVTNLSQGVANFRWATADKLVVVSDVHPACTGADFDACTKKKVEEKGENVRVYDKLFVRHWDTWEDGLRSHILWVDVKTGEAKDLTPGDADVPPYPGPNDFDVSPDGSELAFGRNDDKDESASTNSDLFVVPRGWGFAEEDRRDPGFRRPARLQPRRFDDRVSRPDARGLRGRPLASHGLRPQDLDHAEPDRALRPECRRDRLVA